MKIVILYIVLLSLALCDEGDKPNYFNSFINQEIVDAIKASGAKWETMPPHKNPLRHYNDKQIKHATSMPGFDYAKYKKELANLAKISEEAQKPKEQIHGFKNTNIPAKAFSNPSSFNWLTSSNGQRCAPAVLNQGTCGGCYGFATAECFSARYCQASGKSLVDFSPQDIIACNRYTGVCNGGVIDYAFHYIEEYGILPLSCIPYGEGSNGDSATVPIQKCSPSACISSGSFSKAFCKKGTSLVIQGTDRIQNELLSRGPVATLMNVYADFMNYNSGIYKYATGASSGPHAVLLVGWGSEGSQNYWIVQNSWGSSWGEKGYFRADMSDTTTAVGEYAFYCVPDV